MDNKLLFHRPDIAARLASVLLGDDPLNQAGRSGLFLAAPRRTGKSTFLRTDLIPAIETTGAIAVYVDLWVDKTRNPADLIAEAVRDKLSSLAGTLGKSRSWLARVKKASAKAKFSGFEAELGFEIDTIGKVGGATLAKAFEGLRAATGRQVVFIIDEAQHALTTAEGESTLFALKAARDALNLGLDRPGLAILATGSMRSKISDLVMGKNQAFYGASVADFPALGKDFVLHLLRVMLLHRFREDQLPDTDRVMLAFKRLGYRPEELSKAITDAVTRPEANISDAVEAAAQARYDAAGMRLHQQMANLPDLQRAIVRRLASASIGEGGASVAVFGKESLQWYAQDLGGTKVTAAMVQKALEALVSGEVVWRASHGSYQLDDELMAEVVFAGGMDARSRLPLPATASAPVPTRRRASKLPGTGRP